MGFSTLVAAGTQTASMVQVGTQTLIQHIITPMDQMGVDSIMILRVWVRTDFGGNYLGSMTVGTGSFSAMG